MSMFLKVLLNPRMHMVCGAPVVLGLASPVTIRRAAAVVFCFCLMLAHVPAYAQTVTPIADIQANPSAFEGQTVTVDGQVYAPANYRGTIFSGYIQDASGRGINLFGSSANNSLLFDVTNVVRVTGTVAIFFNTVEITNLTAVTLISNGNLPLEPQQVSTAGANSSAWEGTFIEVTGVITWIQRTENSTPPSANYTVNDGSGSTVVRVADTASPGGLGFGQTITGRGAGSKFSSTYQILVGRAEDVFEIIQPQPCTGDITLNSQAEVDAFDCTEVAGDILIIGGNITNLDALSSLTSVGGFLSINTNFTLANVDGLSSLTSVGGGLVINSNPALTNIDGLSNLTSVGGDQSMSFRDLVITFNYALTDVDALSSLTSVGGRLAIRFNSALANVDGLSNLTSVGGNLDLFRNPALTRCCGLFPLLDARGVGGSIIFGENGAGCTEDEILDGGPCYIANAIIAIDELIAGVHANLSEPESNGLIAKLNEAIGALQKVHVTPATNKLKNFIDQVNAHVNSGKLTATEGQQLVDAANAIIESLQSPSKTSVLTVRASVEESTWSSVKSLYR